MQAGAGPVRMLQCCQTLRAGEEEGAGPVPAEDAGTAVTHSELGRRLEQGGSSQGTAEEQQAVVAGSTGGTLLGNGREQEEEECLLSDSGGTGGFPYLKV